MWEGSLYSKIFANGELIDLERQGFERGRGKTMDVDWLVVSLSLKKQMADLEYAINVGQGASTFSSSRTTLDSVAIIKNAPSQGLYNLDEIKRAIADVRNVAGCLFLKIQEIEKKRKEKTSD